MAVAGAKAKARACREKSKEGWGWGGLHVLVQSLCGPPSAPATHLELGLSQPCQPQPSLPIRLATHTGSLHLVSSLQGESIPRCWPVPTHPVRLLC